MISTDSPTFDSVLALARRLAPADKLRLSTALTAELTAALAPPRSSAHALLAHPATWSGDDFPVRLAEVYGARQPLEE